MSLTKELQTRGFIHQSTTEDLTKLLDGEKRTIYLGVDPSADSIHAGNFVGYMLLRHLAAAGHKVILLVGGGTGLIGDPKPDVERPLLSIEEIQNRSEKLRSQASHLLQVEDLQLVNNYEWLGKLNLLEFLRDIGKHFTVNELMKKDAIATRLAGENGISYTEFAYPLLQAYDYFELHKLYGCNLQIGGSDQWGNMIAGVDLIRRKSGNEVHVLTTPLVVDKATGKKFGKSEGNAIWLDENKTTPYQFYQFWLNVSDESVVDYLKLFTMLDIEEITSISLEAERNPGARRAQRILAREVTQLVHGEKAALGAEGVSEILFGDSQVKTISETEIEMLLKNAPNTNITGKESIVDLLVQTELATSKREARTFIESGAISVNGDKVTDVECCLTEESFLGPIAILRRGKKQLCVLVRG